MPISVTLPAWKAGDTFRVITELLKQPGDSVEENEVLLTFDDMGKLGVVVSPQDGTLEQYFYKNGEQVPFDVPVCSLVSAGSDDESDGDPFAEGGEEADGEQSDIDKPPDEESAEKEEKPVVYADPIQKIKNQLELITQRNMIVQVSEFILKQCDGDYEFYEQVHNPKKSLENCIKYINNQAKKLCEDMVKLNGNNPGGAQSIAIDGDQVFKWAVEYFGKENLTEDGYKPPSKKKEAKKGASKGKSKAAGAKSAANANAPAEAEVEQQKLF